jgi:hypothetical protein
MPFLSSLKKRSNPSMDEYLTVKELSSRIKMAEGTIRNLVWKNQFQQNIHYVKPTPRKILFLWSAIEVWLREEPAASRNLYKERPNCLIR